MTSSITNSASSTATSYPVDKIKVVLLENVHKKSVETFESAGFQVHHYTKAFSGDELLEIAGDAHLIGIRSKTNLTADFFEKSKNLWGVGCFCIGTNQVDLEAAAAKGVPVFNEAFSNTRSVAELVIAEMISLNRQLIDRSNSAHQGKWLKNDKGAHEVRGRNLGIIGYGRIGSQVSILAEALGMKVRYYDVVSVLPLGNAQKVEQLEDLLAWSDIVTLHVPANPTTKNLIGEKELSLMKPDAFLINNARGDVVDVEALANALRNQKLGGAAVDVFPKEPESTEERFESVLQGLNNVILTPHIGGSTMEAQKAIAESVSARLLKLMNNGSTDTAVNVPQVQLPRLHSDHRRILHFHKNVPGVLRQINTATADLEVNVAAQFLQTSGDYAYAIMDVAHDRDELLLKRLKQIPETIRVRELW
jgi:D-3-phosphoglycerate dehydrogenase